MHQVKTLEYLALAVLKVFVRQKSDDNWGNSHWIFTLTDN